MKKHCIGITGALAVAAAVGLVAFSVVSAQAPAASDASSLKTPWGTPNLQGIWANTQIVPLERPKEFGAREFKTDEEMVKAEQDLIERVRTAGPGRDSREVDGKPGIGTEADVARAYNEFWFGDDLTKPGRRTSQVIDPPDGRLPPTTKALEERTAAQDAYLAALRQGTAGGPAGAPSPRRFEPPPRYNLDRMNRADGPEDRSVPGRCLGDAPPTVIGAGGIAGSFRIVQSNDSVAFYYDLGQGQGYSLVVPITNVPHLPSYIREYRGDARGRWEGDTLVVDTTNFTQKTDFRGSRENLHIVERYRRTSANTLEYRLTVEDPTTWTRPWTLVQDLTIQDNKANLVIEGGCHEGNYGLVGILAGARAAEKAFKEGRGPDPATMRLR